MVLSFSNCSSRAILHGSSTSTTSCSTCESDKAADDVNSRVGVDILLGATVGVPVIKFFVGPGVDGIYIVSGATFVARGGGVADGCTSNSSVKRQAAKTISITNSYVIHFKDINLIPPVAHSICQMPTHESGFFTRSHLTNHTTIYHVA